MGLKSLLFLQLFSAFLVARATPSRTLFERTPVQLGKRATCTPASAGDASVDDVPAIQAAISSCGNGGVILIPAGKEYMIRSVLSFSGCSNCDFQLEGTLKVSDDTSYWNGKKAVISVSGITGLTFRSATGAGLLDGNGQAAWDLFATDSSFDRPTLHYITGSKNVAVTNLRVKNPPNATGSSSSISYSSLSMSAVSSSSNAPKNTDGFDVGPASYVTYYNISVTNDDDCIAFKSGANYISVDTITCKGSHGISVGSLGSKAGSTDSVSNVYVKNANMQTSTKAVGIKLYPGGSSHGTAVVRNVTWDTVTVSSCGYAAQIQSCYDEDASYCASYPSTASVTDVYFKNFKGTTSTQYEPTIANIDCPGAGTCDVYFSGWSVSPPSGNPKYLCANIDNSSPGITCSSGASG